MSSGPAFTGVPSVSAISSMPRESVRLSTRTSSDSSSICCVAAPIAMRVATQDANPARSSQPGVTRSPLPPNSPGMSVGTSVPFAWLAITPKPPVQRATACESS
jgi:hypothetical protein